MLVSEVRADQAMGLRRLANPKPVKVVAVSGGKGGIGKTNVSVNLALAMANEGKRVMLLDADFGLANIDVLLGLHPTANLSHVLKGDVSLDDIIVQGPGGVRIVPASSGLREMSELSDAQHAGIISAFSELSHDVDTLIIDTAAGISANVTNYSRAAQEVVIVLCDEPASITDSYALIKLLNKDYGLCKFHVVANMVTTAQDGRALFNKLSRVTDRYLDVALDFMGTIPYDEYLKKSVQKQKAVFEAYPRSKSALAFRKLAQKAGAWPEPSFSQGHMEFFVERLIHASRENRG